MPASTLLIEQLVADAGALGRLQASEECSLVESVSVRTDLQRFLAIPFYLDNSLNIDLVEEFFVEIKKVRLPMPMLKSLNYFRQHEFHTLRHILMVFNLSTLLVKEVSLDKQRSDVDFIAGAIRDFVKITVSFHILKKAGPLIILKSRFSNTIPWQGIFCSPTISVISATQLSSSPVIIMKDETAATIHGDHKS